MAPRAPSFRYETVLVVALLALAGAGAHAAGPVVIEDFADGVANWKPEMFYGDVAGCKPSLDGKALRVDVDFKGPETNHIIYARPVNLDLSYSESLSFEVKGAGDPVSLFLFVWDSQGRFSNYGPHGTNLDFSSGYADWHTCRVTFDRDHSVQGGNADLADIKKIGWMLWQMGPKKGTVWLRNLSYLDAAATVKCSPSVFSPNGDGIYDTAAMVLRIPRKATATVEVLNIAGRVIARLATDLQPGTGRTVIRWNGRSTSGASVPGGRYIVQATFRGEKESKAVAVLAVDNSHKWPPLKQTPDPFFPIGLWFEGAPSINGGPADPAGAKAYYDRCFADISRHGFNCIAVPNSPMALWEPMLKSAEEHGLKVVLEIGALAALVSRPDPATEADVYAAAKPIVDMLSKYPALLRYQTRDEPGPEMIPNWVVLQRIMAALDPKRPTFSCFCGTEALAALTKTVPLSEAVFDIYPHRPGTPPQTLGSFLPTLDAFTKASGANPMWAVLGDFAVGASWRYPSPEELRAVTYLSLAAGAKGAFYFIYQFMPGYLDGLVKPDGAPTPMWEPTAALARELGTLAPVLMALKPDATAVEVQGEARVGHFRDANGKSVLIVASTKPAAAQTVTVKIEGKWKDALTGEALEGKDGALAVALVAGGGRVLVGE
jgi:hypothetical protein